MISQHSTSFAETVISNTATASFSINGNPQSLSDSVQFVKDEVVEAEDQINLQKQADKTTADVDDLITYSLSVNNPNAHDLTNVSIQDTLPQGLLYVAGSARLNGTALNNSQINYAGNSLTLQMGSLPAQQSWTVTYQLKVSASTPPGIAINQAIVISDTVTSAPSQASVNITITPPVKPLTITKTSNHSHAKVGENIRYNITITNPNSYEVSGISVEDNFPQGLIYQNGSASLNNGVANMLVKQSDISINGTKHTFKLGDIPASAQWKFTYDANITNQITANSLSNTARVIAQDAAANSNSSQATLDIVSDNILLTKQADKIHAKTGDTVTYSVFVENPSLHELVNLKIQDMLPVGFNYQVGSAKLDGIAVSASNIQSTGRSLQISAGNLGKGKKLTLAYQVEIAETANYGDAINQVQASSDFGISDLATATVKIRTPSIIEFLKIDAGGVNEVIQPTAYNDNQSGGKHWQEISTIVLPDGSTLNLPNPQPIIAAQEYSPAEPIIIQVQDLDQNLDPHKLDTIIVTVEVPGTNDREVLLLTETSENSGIFRGVILTDAGNTDVQNGRLTLKDGVKINVSYRDQEDSTDTSATAALVIPDTHITLSKSSDKTYTAIGELVRYSLAFTNSSGYSLPKVDIQDKLPVGFRYLPGSARLNGEKINTSSIKNDGRLLTFSLSGMQNGNQWVLEYVTRVSAGAKPGKAINEARINSGSINSNIARSTVEIVDELMRSKNILTGRVYIGCKTREDKEGLPKVLRNARIVMETGRNVLSDEEGFWHMEGVEPGSHVLQLDKDSLPRGYEPLLCRNNTRHAGDAKSQFVDLQPGSIWRVDFHVKENKDAIKGNSDNLPSSIKPANPLELFGNTYLENAPQGFEILWPKNNFVPSVGSTKVIVKSSPQHKVKVFLNGKEVSPLNYDGSDTNKAKTVTIRRWLGVDIDTQKRNNALLVVLYDKSGKEIERKTHIVHFSGEAASAQFLADQSVLIADGRTTPVITIRVKDQDGYPMRANTHGYFSLNNSDFEVKTLTEDKDKLDLNESLAGTYKYLIEEGGIARIQLNPTTRSGEIKLKLNFANKQPQIINAWLKPHLREWIMVGIAEGTLAHKSLSGNMQTLNDLDKDDSFVKSGRIAFYAKGRIKGKYLLTIAYDTHKQRQETGSQLNGNIDPDAWYTIYADNSSNQYDAPSSRKLYLKIEKENFYALFGDYHSGLSVTELAKYERVLNGIKSEYNGKRYSYNAFISETSNQHQHAEMPGDGTSGLYRLVSGIIPNSESIRIETRDRFHSDRILESRELSRYQDYEIDYQAGTLFFKFPINSRDQNLNPNIIVVDYDTESNSNQEITAGGRIAFKTENEKLEVGLSGIREGRNKSKANTLIGTDVTYKITQDTELHAEFAQSKTEQGLHQSKHAYVLELEKQIASMEARLYHKKRDKDFGINSQASENGIKKSGAELRYRLDSNTDINAEVSHQQNLENDNQRQLAEVGIKRQYKQVGVRAGVRHSREKLEDKTLSNNAILAGGNYTTNNGKVTFRGDIEKNIGGDSGSEASPDRAIVGVDVKLDNGITLFAEHETTDNDEITTHNNRVGVSKSLWKGAKAKTSYTQERTDQGQREYANLGLNQRIDITDKIKADFSVDQAKTIKDNRQPLQFNENEPAIQGALSDDFTAFTVGLGADDKDWSWTSRFELRNGEENDKISLRAGVIRHLEDGKNLSARFSFYQSDFENGDFENHTQLSLGSAWHPLNKNFVILNRLDLVDKDKSLAADEISGLETHTRKIIHNVHYNRKLNEKTQLSLHHGIKHVQDINDDVDHATTIDTAMLEVRRDINSKWDVGIHGGYLHDWNAGSIEALAGVSVGVTPMENSWLSVGYNFEGFYDKDFDKSEYQRQGPYVNFKYKFNQDSFDGDLPIRSKYKNKKTAPKSREDSR